MGLNPSITDWRGRRVWLIGASSGIGLALAEALSARGAYVIVSARPSAALDAFAKSGPMRQAAPLDVTDQLACQQVAAEIGAAGALDLVCYCAGYYQPMRADAMDLDIMLRHQRVNVEGALCVLAAIMPKFLQQAKEGKAPHVSLVSSVAGLRGLPQSLAYGSTKAALINFAETLFLDLRPKGVGVSVVLPGFVATPMTAQNTFPMPALITPDQAAQAILRGWSRGTFAISFPKRFTFWMYALRWLPARWYFALVHKVTGL